jgi:hypothetical protein
MLDGRETMKKLLRFGLRGLVTLVGLLVIAGLVTFTAVDSRELPPASLPAAAVEAAVREGELRAGFARVKLTPTVGSSRDVPERGEFRSLPLAGYGNRQGKPATGVHDDLWVKAIAFAAGGQTGVVVCADALIVPREVTDLAMVRIATETGLRREQVYFSATHTHCSLGGWGEGPVGEAFAGPFQPAVRIWFAGQLAAATAQALQDLTPASVGHGTFSAPQFIRNRLVGDRGQIDPEFALLLVKRPDGSSAVLGSFGAHATILGGGTMDFSAEYPGAWARAVEQATGGMALFAAGGVGSHSAKAPAGGFEGVEKLGQSLATETLTQLPRIGVTNRVRFGVLGATLELPELQARVTDDVRLRPWAAAKLLPVGTRTLLQGFRFNDALWLSTPCDFSGELALELKAEVRARGQHLQVTSFNGDYVGYVIPAKYYHLEGYEPRTMSFFGPHLPDLFMGTLRQVAEKLAQ